MFKTKAFDTTVQAAGDADLADGEFDAVVAVFNNVDTYGDRILPGAFADTLQDWAAKGQDIPVIWAHDWADPFSHIGVVKSARETDRGLQIRGFISPEERDANPKAAQVWRLLKARRVTQFSFAFDVLDAAETTSDGDTVMELRTLKLHEVGPCLLGVNQETELLAAKAARLSGAQLGPTARAAIVKAHEELGRILDITPTTTEDSVPGGGEAPGDGPQDAHTGGDDAANPTGGPASDPGTVPASTTRQLLEIELELATTDEGDTA